MSKLKYDWKYGENETQRYYEVNIGKDYLCVFANKWNPDTWMGISCGKTIFNKTKNNKQRRKEKVSSDTPVYLLKSSYVLSSTDYVYMMKKVEYCYRHNLNEISE